ncbi:MAG: hypothetical protein ACREHG_09325, partial [Candidatus Saccharimonadales bacterium]
MKALITTGGRLLLDRLLLSGYTFVRRTWLLTLALGLASFGVGLNIAIAHAQDVSISTARNCDANAVVYCGAGSVSTLISKYNNGDGRNTAVSIHNIFDHFGITGADINGIESSNVQAGSVTKSGDVFDAGGKLVAKNALTGGRADISGSTKVVVGKTVFYTRPPSVSFLSSPLSAFVVMNNGRFSYAILAS